MPNLDANAMAELAENRRKASMVFRLQVRSNCCSVRAKDTVGAVRRAWKTARDETTSPQLGRRIDQRVSIATLDGDDIRPLERGTAPHIGARFRPKRQQRRSKGPCIRQSALPSRESRACAARQASSARSCWSAVPPRARSASSMRTSRAGSSWGSAWQLGSRDMPGWRR